MKRQLTLLLALMLLLTLTACGGKKTESEETPENTVEETVTETTPETEVESGETETEPGTEEDQAGTDAEQVEPEEIVPAQPETLPAAPEEEKPENLPVQPEETPETQPVVKPEETPVETPEQTDPAEPSGSVDLTAFYESVASSQPEWPAMMPLETEMLDAFYPGLTGIATKQCSVLMPMMSSVVCEIALVEVEQGLDVQAVEEIFQARINYQVGDDTNPGGAWYPESIEGWKNDSRVVSNGNYVMLVAFSGAESIVASFNALFA